MPGRLERIPLNLSAGLALRGNKIEITPTPDTHSFWWKFGKGNRHGMNWQCLGMNIHPTLRKTLEGLPKS